MTTSNPPASALNAAREIPHETVDRARKTLRDMSLIPSYGESTCRLLGGIADGLDKAAFQMQVDDELGEPGPAETARQNCIAAKHLLEPIYGSTNFAPIGSPIAKTLDHLDAAIDATSAIIAKHSQPYAGAGEKLLETLHADLEEQKKHVIECYVLGSAGSKMHWEEKVMSQGVVQGIEYCIERLKAALTPRVASVGLTELERQQWVADNHAINAGYAFNKVQELTAQLATAHELAKNRLALWEATERERDSLRSQLSDAQREVVRLEQIVSGSIRP